jgi:hypothetical protein
MIAPQIRMSLLSDRINERLAPVARLLSRDNFSAVAARGRVANLRLVAAFALVTGPIALFTVWAVRFVRGRRVLVSVDDLDVAATEPA